MKQTDALYLLDRAQNAGFSQVRITRISKSETAYTLFGLHPDKTRGRITRSDVDKAEAAQRGANP